LRALTSSYEHELAALRVLGDRYAHARERPHERVDTPRVVLFAADWLIETGPVTDDIVCEGLRYKGEVWPWIGPERAKGKD
jgi:hypothetical protein